MSPSISSPSTSSYSNANAESLLDLGDGADLARLPKHVRDTLTRNLAEGRERLGLSLLELLRRPQVVARLLETLSGEVLYVLSVLSFIGRAPTDRFHEHLSLKLGADMAVRAVDAANRAGFLVHSAYEPRQVWISPTVQAALRPPLAKVLAHDGASPSWAPAEHALALRRFEDGALLAAVAGLQPKLTQAGEVFKRDLLAMHPVFADRFADPTLLAEEIDLLCDLGLVAVGSRLEVPKDAVEAFAALDLAEELRRHTLARARAVPTLGSLWQLLYLAGPVQLTTLVELADLDAAAEPTLWRRGRARTIDGPTRIDLLLLQPGVGVADVGRVRVVGLSPALRSALSGDALPTTEAAARPHLLPSLEAVVPPECPLPLLVDLGRFLEVEAVDTVVRLKLTRESVERAARRGLTAEQMLATLESLGSHGVPDNLARAVRDFAQARPNRVQVVERPVVIVLDPSVKEMLRTDVELGPALEEVTPNVFALREGSSSTAVRRRLAILGLQQPGDDDDNQTPRLTRWDGTDASRRLSKLRQGFLLEGPLGWARKVRSTLLMSELGPGLPGASERLPRARAALVADPELLEKFVQSLGDDERDDVRRKLERLLDANRPIIEQLDRLDRLAPDWFVRAKARRKRTKTTG